MWSWDILITDALGMALAGWNLIWTDLGDGSLTVVCAVFFFTKSAVVLIFKQLHNEWI